MDPELKWAIGIAVTVCVTFVSALIGAFRTLASRTADGDKDLHNRIDEVQEKYVRRDDLDGHIQRLESTIKDLREETRENHKQVIAALTHSRQ